MTREQVDGMLKEYRLLIGRCGHIDAEIRRLEGSIAAARERFVREAAAPPVSRITGLPRGSAVGNPTERIALMLADGSALEVSDTGAAIRAMEARIDALSREKAEKQLRVEYVRSWLEGLADRERWVIEHHIIDREIWHDIIIAFNQRYTDDVSKDRLKRLQQRALEKIYSMAV